MILYVKTLTVKEYETTEDNDLDYILREYGDLETYAKYQYKRGVKISETDEEIISYEVYGATEEEKERIDEIEHEKMIDELNDVYNREIAF